VTRLLRPVVLLGLLATVAVLASCGGGSATSVTAGEPISVEQLSQAMATSADATTGRFAFSLEMTMPDTTKPFALSGEGAFDAHSDRAALSLDLSAFAELLGGMFAGLAGGNADAPDFGDPAAWRIEAVQDGEVMYMRFPAMASELPAGKSWVRMDLGEAAKGQGFDFSGLQELTGNDPRKVLGFLRAASAEIETVGREELRGVQTTHYRATLNLAEYGKLAPADEREELGTMLGDVIEQTGLDEIPVDVWLDEFGLVRQLDMSFTATQPGTTESVEAAMRFELFDYGKEVEVEPPPAAEVVDAAVLD
jgi:hypothetical protein